MSTRVIVIFLVLGFQASGVAAEEGASPPSALAPPPQTAEQVLEPPVEQNLADTAPKKSKKRIVSREKEFEGTQAPNRFQGDPVIKSRYKLGDQALEVDPD